MSEIFVQSFGSGTAIVDNPYPSGGDLVTLRCFPDEGASLEDIIYTDSYDHYIALPVGEEVQFRFNAAWNNLYIEAYFTGSTPPPHHSFPLWLICKAAQNWRER